MGDDGSSVGSGPSAAAPATAAAAPVAAPVPMSAPVAKVSVVAEDGAKQDGGVGADVLAALERQVDFYFSLQNLASDVYMQSQMNAQKWIAVDVIASFPKVMALTSNREVLLDAMRRCKNCSLSPDGSMAQATAKPERRVLILRDVPADTDEADVLSVFEFPGAAAVQSLRSDIGDTWFVTFASEADCLTTFSGLLGRKRNGKPIRAGIKSESVTRSFYSSPATSVAGGDFTQSPTSSRSLASPASAAGGADGAPTSAPWNYYGGAPAYYAAPPHPSHLSSVEHHPDLMVAASPLYPVEAESAAGGQVFFADPSPVPSPHHYYPGPSATSPSGPGPSRHSYGQSVRVGGGAVGSADDSGSAGARVMVGPDGSVLSPEDAARFAKAVAKRKKSRAKVSQLLKENVRKEGAGGARQPRPQLGPEHFPALPGAVPAKSAGSNNGSNHNASEGSDGDSVGSGPAVKLTAAQIVAQAPRVHAAGVGAGAGAAMSAQTARPAASGLSGDASHKEAAGSVPESQTTAAGTAATDAVAVAVAVAVANPTGQGISGGVEAAAPAESQLQAAPKVSAPAPAQPARAGVWGRRSAVDVVVAAEERPQSWGWRPARPSGSPADSGNVPRRPAGGSPSTPEAARATGGDETAVASPPPPPAACESAQQTDPGARVVTTADESSQREAAVPVTEYPSATFPGKAAAQPAKTSYADLLKRSAPTTVGKT